MKLRIAAAFFIGALILFGFLNREALTDWVAARLWPALEEPVPTFAIERKRYQVRVAAEGHLTGFQTTPVITPRVRGSLKVAWLREEGSIVEPGDVLVRFDSTDARLALDTNENSVAGFERKIEKTEADRRTELESLAKERELAQLELAYSRHQVRRDETIFSRWEIQESIISAALAEYKQKGVDQKSAIREHLSQADLKILNIERQKAQNEVDQAETTLSSLEVRAPVAGVVLYRTRGFWKLEVGREVWPGQPLMELAALNQYQGNLRVAETDIAGVEAGKPVDFTLGAFPERGFTGSIEQVDTIPQQISRRDPRKYFNCKVKFDVPLEVLEKLKPGMSLNGEILVSSNESAFVVPKSAVFKEDDQLYLFVEEGESYERIDIEILESDHGFYLIDGAEAGSRVCLRHPFEKEKLQLPDFNAPAAASSQRRFTVFFN